MDRLYRSRQDRMLAGVAGGLAESWDADPTVIRVLWALLVVFTGGVALLVYIVMAFVVPDEDDARRTGAFGAVGTAPAADIGGASAGAPAAGQGWTAPATDQRAARREARAARRAAEPDSGLPGAAIAGGILVIIRGFFLARLFLPSIDFDLVWPAVLIAIGVLLVVSALRRPGGGAS